MHHREKRRDSKDAYSRLLIFTYCQQSGVKYRLLVTLYFFKFLESLAVFDDKI